MNTPIPTIDCDLIQQLLQTGNVEELCRLAQAARSAGNAGAGFLIEAAAAYAQGDWARTVRSCRQAKTCLNPAQLPHRESIFTGMFINAQLNLPRPQRPATSPAYAHYKSNLAILRKLDLELVHELQPASWPEEIVLVEYWTGLHFFGLPDVLQVLSAHQERDLAALDDNQQPLAFVGLNRSPCLRYCLEHPWRGLHGMCRAHYFLEPDPALVKILLHLDDFSAFLDSRELIIFGGSRMKARLQETFSTLRYPIPRSCLGPVQLYDDCLEGLDDLIQIPSIKDTVSAYYRSGEFRQRQQRIARGEIQPRILVSTARWTTFLKYCAADFEHAFQQLGCPTFYSIEANDAQRFYEGYYWRLLRDFLPDAVFIITHARPTASYLPRELPIIAYIQDRCGRILTEPDLSPLITPQDLFACQAEYFVNYLGAKKIPRAQMFTLPVPANQNDFYPLPPDHPGVPEYSCDISFVKHGHPPAAEYLKKFSEEQFSNLDANYRSNFAKLFAQFTEYAQGPAAHLSEEDMISIANSLIIYLNETYRGKLYNLITHYNVTVYSAAWRCKFLEALAQTDLDLRLYGKDWDLYPALTRHARGPAARGEPINAVYNFSRINLHINHVATMHQRVIECALAGGFIMIAWVDPAKVFESITRYFDPDDLVFFRTPAECVEKCRYYLDHPEERQEKARRLHEKAKARHTTLSAAQRILMEWRKLLLNNPLRED